MLAAHSDVRALVHSAGHNLDDECWMIMLVKEQGVSKGYTLKKSQVFGNAHNFEIS